MTSAPFADVIGAKFRVYPLKSRGIVAKRALRWLRIGGHSLNPIPYLIEAEDGRRFKLQRAEPENRYKIKLLLFRYETASALDFVPRLVWHDECNLLTEYVEGTRPDLSSRAFARAFGRNLAKINGLDVGVLPVSTIRRTAELHLAELVVSGMLDSRTAKRVRDRLADSIPPKMRTSLVYADLQATNFCFADDGRLIFFDLSGFQRGRLTDEGFLGHLSARKLDFEVFRDSYLDAGGPNDLFAHEEILLAFSDLRRGAKLTRLAADLPLTRARTRRAYRRRAEEHAEGLQRFARGTV